jgi:hypothetical protein
MGCLVSLSFATRENQSHLDCLAITGDLWYSGYKTPMR